jgi:glycosyltransferase involved in cell wall biosynthesis
MKNYNKNKKVNISAIIITKNEENNIAECLESIKWVDEIIVVDQSSSDNTVGICKKYTDKVFTVEAKDYCEPDRAVALEKAQCEWILYLDADERVPDELKREILQTINGKGNFNYYKCYYLARRNHFVGKWIKNCGWYPGYVLRLFKKGTVTFSESIHQDGKTSEKCGYLKNDLIHLSYSSLESYFEKFNRYTSRLATEEFEKGKKVNKKNFVFLFLIKPLIWFFHRYFILKGFRDGFYGFFISFSSALVILITSSKLWEKQKDS